MGKFTGILILLLVTVGTSRSLKKNENPFTVASHPNENPLVYHQLIMGERSKSRPYRRSTDSPHSGPRYDLYSVDSPIMEQDAPLIPEEIEGKREDDSVGHPMATRSIPYRQMQYGNIVNGWTNGRSYREAPDSGLEYNANALVDYGEEYENGFGQDDISVKREDGSVLHQMPSRTIPYQQHQQYLSANNFANEGVSMTNGRPYRGASEAKDNFDGLEQKPPSISGKVAPKREDDLASRTMPSRSIPHKRFSTASEVNNDGISMTNGRLYRGSSDVEDDFIGVEQKLPSIPEKVASKREDDSVLRPITSQSIPHLQYPTASDIANQGIGVSNGRLYKGTPGAGNDYAEVEQNPPSIPEEVAPKREDDSVLHPVSSRSVQYRHQYRNPSANKGVMDAFDNDRIGIPKGFFRSSSDSVPLHYSARQDTRSQNRNDTPIPAATSNRFPSPQLTSSNDFAIGYCQDYVPSIHTAPLIYPDPSSRRHFITCGGKAKPIRAKCPAHRIFSNEHGVCIPERHLCNCLNGGQCNILPDGNIKCQCPAGFTGDRCELDDHPCSTDRCYPGACLNTTSDPGFICHCPDFVFSDNCETSVPNRCKDIFPAQVYPLPDESLFVFCTETGLAFVNKCPEGSKFDGELEACVELQQIAEYGYDDVPIDDIPPAAEKENLVDVPKYRKTPTGDSPEPSFENAKNIYMIPKPEQQQPPNEPRSPFSSMKYPSPRYKRPPQRDYQRRHPFPRQPQYPKTL